MSEESEVTSGSGESGNGALLDDLFDSALEACQAGREPELRVLVDGRAHLREDVEETLRLAREVALHAPRNTLPVMKLGGYELERELGAGAMGTVFLARQSSLGGRRVALKVLPPSLGRSSGARARFLAEARALAKLDQPGVVRVFDAVEAEGLVAYTMEWVPGGSLARLIASWRVLPVEDELETLASDLGLSGTNQPGSSVVTWLVSAFARLARALADVHKRELLHRDIKPGNLLVGQRGELLLADFGLVRDSNLSHHTRTGAVLGTLAYSSPEQLRGEHERIDERSDLYSLGVTLYEALTLRLPFPASNAAERQRQAESGFLPRPARRGARLPRDLETILAKLLEPEPARRYASAAELADDLEALLAFRPIRARPAGLVTRLWKSVRRNRGTLFAVGFGVMFTTVASVAAGAWLWRTPDAIDARQRAARLLLLESERIDESTPLGWDAGSTSRVEPPSQVWLAKLEDASALYDSAHGLDPFDLFGRAERLATEREVVQVVRALFDAVPDHTGCIARLRVHAPLAAEVAARWTCDAPARPAPEELAAAHALDRDALGLFGYLVTDTSLSQLAWGGRRPDSEPDVLADGAIGVVRLYEKRFGHAYHHLGVARRLAPESAYLCRAMASCAVGLDSLDEADGLLSEPVLLGRDDDFVEHVRADLLAARGHYKEAFAIYAQRSVHSGASFLEGYAAVALLAEQYRTEVDVRNANAYYRPTVVRYRKEALDAFERWWWSLGDNGRRSVIRQLLRGDRSGLAAVSTMQGDRRLPEVALEYLASYGSLPATRPDDSPPPRSWRPPACGPRAERVQPPFLRVAEDLVTCGVRDAEWSAFPAWIRESLLVLWLSPVPDLPRRACTALLVAAARRSAR